MPSHPTHTTSSRSLVAASFSSNNNPSSSSPPFSSSSSSKALYSFSASPNNSYLASASSYSHSASSSASTPISRIRNIASHMATPVAATNFPAEAVPQAPEDALFGLMRAYRADDSKDKVDLVGHPRIL